MFKALHHRSNVIISLFVALVIIIGFFIFISNRDQTQITKVEPNQPQSAKTIELVVNNVQIIVEVAAEPSEITQGLSGRKSLGEKNGMYFELGKRKIAAFWMKDMLFPIDIIWIDDGEIVYIVENAQPPKGENIPSFTPDKLATHVLEVNGGFVEENNIKIEDNVVIPAE